MSNTFDEELEPGFITLEDLAAARRPCKIRWRNGEKAVNIDVYYNPNVLTPELSRQLKARQSEIEDNAERAEAWVIEMILALVVDWEVYATKQDRLEGNPFPLEESKVAKLPGSLLGQMLKQIIEDSNLDPEGLAGASEGGSGSPTSMTRRRDRRKSGI